MSLEEMVKLFKIEDINTANPILTLRKWNGLMVFGLELWQKKENSRKTAGIL